MNVLKLAIWFHDIIYISQRKDNEEVSAKLFKKSIQKVCRLRPIKKRRL